MSHSPFYVIVDCKLKVSASSCNIYFLQQSVRFNFQDILQRQCIILAGQRILQEMSGPARILQGMSESARNV